MANPSSSSKCLVGLGLHGIRSSPPMQMPAQFKSVVELSKRMMMSQSRSRSPKLTRSPRRAGAAGAGANAKLGGHGSPLLESFPGDQDMSPGNMKTPRAGDVDIGLGLGAGAGVGTSYHPAQAQVQTRERERNTEANANAKAGEPFCDVPFALHPGKTFRIHASPLVGSPASQCAALANAREDNYSTICSPSETPLLGGYGREEDVEGMMTGMNRSKSGASCSPVAKIETILGPRDRGIDFEKRDYHYLYSRLKQSMSPDPPMQPLNESMALNSADLGTGMGAPEVGAGNATMARARIGDSPVVEGGAISGGRKVVASPLANCVATFESLKLDSRGADEGDDHGSDGEYEEWESDEGPEMPMSPLLMRTKDSLLLKEVQKRKRGSGIVTATGTGLTSPLVSRTTSRMANGVEESEALLCSARFPSLDPTKEKQTTVPDTPIIAPRTRSISGSRELDELMSPLQLSPGLSAGRLL